MGNTELTDKNYWDKYWINISLPKEMKKSKDNLYLNCILNIFDSYLPENNNYSIMEIGGAPGQYLAYMHKTFGYEVNCLDYSEVGCKKTIENLKLLNISGKIYNGNLFDETTDLPLFDIVYSLGFIEHFTELDFVIKRHLDLLKPDGILLIGLPNFLGINHFFLKRLYPERLATHYLFSMDISTWTRFEKKFNLKTIFKGYIGGFEPSILYRRGKGAKTIWVKIVNILDFTLHSHFNILRKLNSRFFSGYVIGIYKKP